VPKKKEEISLLPEEETSLDRVSNWLTETGRWIVVFTLLFVLLAFLSRFWLDQKIANLYAQTAQKIAIIESAQDFEDSFRGLQSQIKIIQSLEKTKPNQAEKIKKIVALLPEDIYLTAITLNDDQVDFTVVSRSEVDLNNFFQNLILCPYLDEINIANISNQMFGLETELSIEAKIIEP
jgi:Tfp pilus assembly protein PilN